MRISDWSSDVCSSDLVGGAEDGAAAAQQGAVEEARLELQDVGVHRALQQPRRAVADADDVPAVVTGRTQHHRPQRRVEAGAVAAAGENADPLRLTHAASPLQVDRKSTRLELQSLMRISYAVFCL